MSKVLGVDLNLGELISDGIQKIKIKAEDEVIDVTIAKHKDEKVRTIDGDFEGSSSMAINIPEEMRNVRLKIIGSVENNLILPPSPHSEPEDLGVRALSLVEDYIRVGNLREASKSIQELRSPSFHPEIVKAAMLLGLNKDERIAKLIMYLLMKKVLSSSDVRTGCVRCVFALKERMSWDFPSRFGVLVGKLVSVGGMDFKDVVEIVVEFDGDHSNNGVTFFNSVMDVVGRGSVVSKSQSRDVAACELFAYRA